MKTAEKNYSSPLLKYSIIILMLTLILSCSATHNNYQVIPDPSPDILQKINLLQQDLEALGEDTDSAEARKLAEASISYSIFLADEYRLVRPPFLHNILVRMGIKDRGLCYQWTEDLANRLALLDLKGFRLHQGVAHKGSEFREHNCVVVTATGQKFYEGIVLDPWRDSGDLYWSAVKTDKYPWKERQPERVLNTYPAIH
jgi:hypothetical protein